MSARNYSNTATVASLASSVTTGDTSVALTSFAGFPAAPFTAAIERDTANEEIVLVTGVSSSTITMTRGYDGTTSKTHPSGAELLHVVVAKDYAEANGHINAATGVHGIGGGSAVVGTTDTQTLTAKTLTAPTITSPTVTGTAAMASATFSGTINVTGLTSLAALTTTGNATVGGTLTVTGASTLAALTATTAHVTGAATVDGDLTVGGSQTVTGDATVDGTLTANIASVINGMGAGNIYLSERGTDLPAPGGAGQAGIWKATDHGIWVLDHESPKRRLTAHWGSGTTFPTTGLVLGDLFEHTGLASTMRYSTYGWRQIGQAEVADAAGRTAISTSYSSALHKGFRVWQSDNGYRFEWNGSAWRKLPGPRAFLGTGLGQSGGLTTVAPNSTSVLITPAVAIPAHSPGELEITVDGQWNSGATCGGALFVMLGSSSASPDLGWLGPKARVHNFGVTVAFEPYNVKATFASDGAAKWVWLAGDNDPGSGSTLGVTVANVQVWQL